jgi:hypothetical protein
MAKLLFLILLGGLFLQSHSQTTFIGRWRLVDPRLKFQDTVSKQAKWGDLEIRLDSTFHIEGDLSSKNSTPPGWHVGDEYNGTWELYNGKRLILRLEPKEDKMFLPYLIIKQGKQKLVLRGPFNLKNKKSDLTFFRLTSTAAKTNL